MSPDKKERSVEQEYKENQAFLDSIIENIPDMIFVKDAKELRFIRFNKAGEDLLGFKKSDLLGKNDYDFFPKDQADFFTSRDRSVLDHKVLVDIPEEPIDTKFKGKRILHTKKIPILDDKGEPRYLLGISEDITDRKKMEEGIRVIEELRELDRMKSEFISVAAHQLRTPLSAVRWTVNLLLGDELGAPTPDQKKFLLKAFETTDRMIGLVNDLLGADRVASDKFRYDMQPVDMLELVDSVVSELLPLAAVRNIRMIAPSRSDKQTYLVKADSEKLRGVLQNLLENSIKYSPSGREVELGIIDGEKEIKVSVKDSGIGIPPEEQARVFERFYRASNAVKVEANGSGLGLYIVKSVIEKHGGRIWFESKVGSGTTFYFTIPKMAAPDS